MKNNTKGFQEVYNRFIDVDHERNSNSYNQYQAAVASLKLQPVDIRDGIYEKLTNLIYKELNTSHVS